MEPEITCEVTDLKQWSYCPRVVYYRYCLPDIRPQTDLMQAGIRRHREEADREERRSLRTYGLRAGERVADLTLQSPTLGIRGRLDLAIALPDRAHGNEAIVIEYKDSEQVDRPHFRIQLTTYALLLEEAWKLPVRQGFFYSIPLRRAEAVAITPALRRKTLATISQLHTSIRHEQMPPAPTNRARCVGCEFRRFCNDVV